MPHSVDHYFHNGYVGKQLLALEGCWWKKIGKETRDSTDKCTDWKLLTFHQLSKIHLLTKKIM